MNVNLSIEFIHNMCSRHFLLNLALADAPRHFDLQIGFYSTHEILGVLHLSCIMKAEPFSLYMIWVILPCKVVVVIHLVFYLQLVLSSEIPQSSYLKKQVSGSSFRNRIHFMQVHLVFGPFCL